MAEIKGQRKPKGAITNGQFRDTGGNIGYTRLRTKTKQNIQHRNMKR